MNVAAPQSGVDRERVRSLEDSEDAGGGPRRDDRDPHARGVRAHAAPGGPAGRNGAEGRACADELLTRLIRVWLANRGVWEAIVGAGPVCSVPAQDEEVDAHLAAWDSLLDALAA